jgi:L-alanine-DL-glutamate epimerase-like enolase superfamily enzyme
VHPRIERVEVSAFKIPTESPESDGTLAWNNTTLVVVEAYSQGIKGLGFTYADTSTAVLVRDKLAPTIVGKSAMATGGNWLEMVRAIRNLGRPGVASMAISAIDFALWDLKSRLLSVSLTTLLGPVRSSIPVYGSGGFTSYSIDELQRQFSGWRAQGITRMKMKVGRYPEHDLERVKAAREAIGIDCELFVDANGAYDRKQAIQMAEVFAELGVTWFEEPVSSDDLEGLRLIRDRAPAGMHIAAGEYGYDLPYFERMLEARAVDVLQADASRCGGVTGFMQVVPLCQARSIPLSAHTAPSLHGHLCCAAIPACHVEYFFDHARIENMFFEGALMPMNGALYPDVLQPGIGLDFKRKSALRFAA